MIELIYTVCICCCLYFFLWLFDILPVPVKGNSDDVLFYIIMLGICFWFFLFALGVLPSQIKKRKIEKEQRYQKDLEFKKCIKKHFNTLLMKYNQKVYKDDYGNYIFDDWNKEIDYFIRNIAPDDEKHEYWEEIFFAIRKDKFNKYWNELIEEYSETEQTHMRSIVVKNGIDYEYYVEKYLENMGYLVKRTPKTGDQGVDLIAEKDGIRKAIQCKYYSKPVGNKAVQEVIAGANFYQCSSAAVISNSSFTKSAKQLAENSNIELFSLIPQ